jgi:parallel beta-helix repeat protein
MRKYILIIATVFVIISSTIHAAELFISPIGNDSSGNGTVQSPYKTIQHALNNVAKSGDTITLRSGTYDEEVRIRMSNITIRSKSDEWAKISTTPTIDGDNATLTVLFDVGSDGSKLQRVEVTGGFYGIAFFSQWDWDDTPLDNDTATNIVIEDCKIHDTGRDAVKLPAGCDDITIRRCEIYNSGIGYPPGTPDDDKNAEGIDVVNSDRILVQDCYIHDTATTGVYIKGGSLDGIVERTKVENCGGLGIAVGFDTSPEYFDLVANPEYYENIRGIVRNCIVLNTKYAGIALYGSKDAVVYNNTIVNTAKLAHSPIYFGITYQDWDPNAKRPANVNPVIMNNIILQTEAINSPCVSVRYSGDLGGMSALKGSAVMNNNCYYKTVGSCVFEDNRPDSLLEDGTFSQWKIHISGESQSMETNPLTDAGYHLTLGSPCIDKGNNVIPGGISSTDKDNKPRIVNGIVDIGAYEFSGSDISVTPATQVVTKDAGATTFSVSNTGTGTMPWTAAVTSGDAWLSITSGASGSNTGTITCSYPTNTTTSARAGTIRVTATGATGSPVDVTVTQAGAESLAASFAASELWIYNSGAAAWSQVSSANPENMIYSGSTLYVDFGASYGLYKWDGAAWNQLTSANPENMVTSGSTLYVNFGTLGLYKWDGAAWSLLTSVNPENMVASGSALYVDFGASYGLYKWDGAAWSQLTSANPENMVTSDSALYVGFGALGLYKWDGTSWSQLTSVNPENIVTSGATLYVNFYVNFGATYGLYKWDGAAWAQLTTVNPENMVSAGSTLLYANFGASYGLYKWDGAAWTRLTTLNPENMVASSCSILYVDFGALGLYKWDGAAWSQLTGSNPVIMTVSN